MKTYIYANSQVLAQHNGPHTAAKYFYLHDRLGSVRQIINTSGLVQKYYTYEPFGQSIESGGTFADPFRFTGQFYDEEIAEYYLRARQYNPTIARFTARDPVFGNLEQPLTLHKYLYCMNDSVNKRDLTGEWVFYVTGTGMASGWGSRIRQSGLIIDGEGNVGWMNLDGVGVGSPMLSLGVTFGLSPNAKTIADMAGTFYSTGASIPIAPAMGLGLEGFANFDTNIFGWEFTCSAGFPPWPEAHIHKTESTVYQSRLNWRSGVQAIQESINAFNRMRTYQDAYTFFLLDYYVSEGTGGELKLLDWDW